MADISKFRLSDIEAARLNATASNVHAIIYNIATARMPAFFSQGLLMKPD